MMGAAYVINSVGLGMAGGFVVGSLAYEKYIDSKTDAVRAVAWPQEVLLRV